MKNFVFSVLDLPLMLISFSIYVKVLKIFVQKSKKKRQNAHTNTFYWDLLEVALKLTIREEKNVPCPSSFIC